MANRFDLMTVYTTLVAKIQEIVAELKAEGIAPNIEYMAWDSRQEVNELPNHDLIGLVDWTFEEADHLPEIECGILLSVVHDANLFREIQIIDKIRSHCVHVRKPEYLTWEVRDESNETFSHLAVTDFAMLPAGESEARTVRQIGISLKRADFAQ